MEASSDPTTSSWSARRAARRTTTSTARASASIPLRCRRAGAGGGCEECAAEKKAKEDAAERADLKEEQDSVFGEEEVAHPASNVVFVNRLLARLLTNPPCSTQAKSKKKPAPRSKPKGAAPAASADPPTRRKRFPVEWVNCTRP